ncbi:hypothetical protein OAD66_06595 [Bacteroidia bacterium]|nr:hypothetical protein [Bacteroidia bacterium]
MMHKKENELFLLIRSLNKSQKLGLSRKWSKSPYSDYIYVQLYIQLLATTRYDATELVESVPLLKPHQLGNVQNELYKKILEYLRLQQVPTPFEEYRILLKNYSVLKGLNLIEQADKWKDKALVFKAKNVIINDAVLVDEETYYYETMSSPDMVSQFKFSNEVSPFTQTLMREYLRLREFYLKHRFSKNKREYHRLESSVKLVVRNLEYDDLSLYDKIVYNRMLYHYHYIQRDFVLGYKYASTLVLLYENNGLNQYYKEVYLKLLNYQMLCVFRLNASERYDLLLKKFKDLRFKPSLPDINLLRESHFKYGLTHSLNLFVIKGKFAEGIELFREAELSFNLLNTKHNSGYVNSIYYKVACLHFGNEEFKECIVYLDKLIYNMDRSGRLDLQIFARILKLTSLFELQETEYIFENIRSVYGYIARNKQLNMFQIEIMNFLRVCARLPTTSIRNEMIHFREALQHVALNKFEQRPFFYFDVISWLDSKLNNKSISEVIGERGLGHRILYENK